MPVLLPAQGVPQLPSGRDLATLTTGMRELPSGRNLSALCGSPSRQDIAALGPGLRELSSGRDIAAITSAAVATITLPSLLGLAENVSRAEELQSSEIGQSYSPSEEQMQVVNIQPSVASVQSPSPAQPSQSSPALHAPIQLLQQDGPPPQSQQTIITASSAPPQPGSSTQSLVPLSTHTYTYRGRTSLASPKSPYGAVQSQGYSSTLPQSNPQSPYSSASSPGAAPLNLSQAPLLCLPNNSSLLVSSLTTTAIKTEPNVTPSKGARSAETTVSIEMPHTSRKQNLKSQAAKKVKNETIRSKSDQQTLKQVMKSESYVALYCTLCNKMFTSQSGLQRHINTAHKDPKDKPFKCVSCGKGFLSERTLKTHTNMHLGVYPYHCQYCQKGFPNQDNLKGHLASHTNVKQFRCESCGQEFTYRTSLNQHIAKAHLN